MNIWFVCKEKCMVQPSISLQTNEFCVWRKNFLAKQKKSRSGRFASVINIDKIIDERAIWRSRGVSHLIHTKNGTISKRTRARKRLSLYFINVSLSKCSFVSRLFSSIMYSVLFVCVFLSLSLCLSFVYFFVTFYGANASSGVSFLCGTDFNAFANGMESAAKRECQSSLGY